MRVLVVDNYDSFAYNLVQYVGEHADVVVRRNDEVDVDGIREIDPDAIVVSPGPGTPAEAGVSVPLFRELDYPTLGVCLGHQALCAANGAAVEHAPSVVHGKPSTVRHDGRGIFEGLPDRLETGRYHSLAVPAATLPDSLVPTAWTVEVGDADTGDGIGGTDDAADIDAADIDAADIDAADIDAADIDDEPVVMAVRHRDRPHAGVQFHPESILTPTGKRLLAGFLDSCSTT